MTWKELKKFLAFIWEFIVCEVLLFATVIGVLVLANIVLILGGCAV